MHQSITAAAGIREGADLAKENEGKEDASINSQLKPGVSKNLL